MSDKNIFILSACPGPVDTPILKSIFREKMSSVNEDVSITPKNTKVMATRCAELIVVAMANSLKEVWISRQPFLIFCLPLVVLSCSGKMVMMFVVFLTVLLMFLNHYRIGNHIGLKRLITARKGQLV